MGKRRQVGRRKERFRCRAVEPGREFRKTQRGKNESACSGNPPARKARMKDTEIQDKARQVARTLNRIIAADEGELEGRLAALLRRYEPTSQLQMNEAFQALFNVSLDSILFERPRFTRNAV